jgi:uncharacterized membrane protein
VNTGGIVRRILSLSASVLLLGLGWWTTAGGLRNVHQAGNLGQWAETAIQLACGALCLATVVTRFWWRPLHRPVRIAWVVTLVTWVSLSALVWGPPMLHIALLFAVVALLIGWALLWALGPVRATEPASAAVT